MRARLVSGVLLVVGLLLSAAACMHQGNAPKCASPEDLSQTETTCMTPADIAGIFGLAYQGGAVTHDNGGYTGTFVPTVPAYAGPIPNPSVSASPVPKPSGTAGFGWEYRFRPVVRLAIVTGKAAVDAWDAYQKQYPDANPFAAGPVNDRLISTKNGGIAAGCVDIGDADKAKYVQVSLDYGRVTAKLTDEQRKFFFAGIQQAVSEAMARFGQ